MAEILILARIKLHEFDLPIITDYYFEVSEKLSKVRGFHGLSVWRDPRAAESFLVGYEYADVASAERGLVSVTEVRVLAETQLADFRPADVTRVRVAGRAGVRLSQTALTTFLSMSVRVADPGYGPELISEVGNVLVELSLLPGFLGSIYGTNSALDEEVVGIATWASQSAYQGSLPRKSGPRKLEGYERFF